MTDVTSLLDDALECMDRCDFSDARAAYRRAALLSPPSDILLDNLTLAENGERLEFRNQLVNLHPDCLKVRVDFINRIFDLRNYAAVATRCTELLQQSARSLKEELMIRRLRFSAIIAGGAEGSRYSSQFKDDFRFILEYIKHSDVMLVQTGWFATALASISGPAQLGMLLEVQGMLDTDTSNGTLRDLLNQKIQELSLLKSLLCREKETLDQGPNSEKGT